MLWLTSGDKKPPDRSQGEGTYQRRALTLTGNRSKRILETLEEKTTTPRCCQYNNKASGVNWRHTDAKSKRLAEPSALQ